LTPAYLFGWLHHLKRSKTKMTLTFRQVAILQSMLQSAVTL